MMDRWMGKMRDKSERRTAVFQSSMKSFKESKKKFNLTVKISASYLMDADTTSSPAHTTLHSVALGLHNTHRNVL